MVMSDEYIDALYLSEAEVLQELVNPLALYYDVAIYTWNELTSVMRTNEYDTEIPTSIIQEYIENVITYCG